MSTPPHPSENDKLAEGRPITSTEELLRCYAAGERYFTDTDLPDGADLRSVTLEDAHFEHGFLHSADFRGANLRGVRFNCNVKCADFSESDLTGASFEGASVESAMFDGAVLEKTRFRGAWYMGNNLLDDEVP
jgi:uncharacterized protein YjbI with pentapeptide repeats